MRDWLTEVYCRVKEARDKELSRILAILRSKAESDIEVKEAVEILERWAIRDSRSCDQHPESRSSDGGFRNDGEGIKR